MTVLIPSPILKPRPINEELEQEGLGLGLHPVVARILAGRPIASHLSILDALSPKLKHLDPPFDLQDIQLAASRVAQAVINGECIGIETDHDCDGQTSHAV